MAGSDQDGEGTSGRLWAGLLLIASLVGTVPASAGVLDQVKANGTLRIGFREDASPLSYKTDDGTPTGYSVELCEGVAEDIRNQLQLPELKLVFVPVTAETRLRRSPAARSTCSARRRRRPSAGAGR